MKNKCLAAFFSLSALILCACQAEQSGDAVNADKPTQAEVVLSPRAEIGKALYIGKGCIGCHGPAGNSRNPRVYPKLTGQSADYLELQLRAFKTYQRRNPMMSSIAVNLTDDEIAQLAAYLSELPNN